LKGTGKEDIEQVDLAPNRKIGADYSEVSSSITDLIYLEQPIEYQLLKKQSDPLC
jgi:hypothetical protein